MAVSSNFDAHFRCPNRCGESYRQEDIENHIKTCHLEEIACDFEDLGCDQKFQRVKTDDHLRECSHEHLQLACKGLQKNRRLLKDLEIKYLGVHCHLKIIFIWLIILTCFVIAISYQLWNLRQLYQTIEDKKTCSSGVKKMNYTWCSLTMCGIFVLYYNHFL